MLQDTTLAAAPVTRNRVLWELPPPGAQRTRRNGARVRTPQQWLHARGDWPRTTVRVRGRDLPLRYRVQGPDLRKGAPQRPLFVLVV